MFARGSSAQSLQGKSGPAYSRLHNAAPPQAERCVQSGTSAAGALPPDHPTPARRHTSQHGHVNTAALCTLPEPRMHVTLHHPIAGGEAKVGSVPDIFDTLMRAPVDTPVEAVQMQRPCAHATLHYAVASCTEAKRQLPHRIALCICTPYQQYVAQQHNT